MQYGAFDIIDEKIIIRIHERICETEEEILSSALFKEILKRAVGRLQQRSSSLLNIFPHKEASDVHLGTFVEILKCLTRMPRHLVPNAVPQAFPFLRDPGLFNDFVEYLYNYWRSYDRFIISDATGKDYAKKPSQTFNMTIGRLTDLVRGMYRDIQGNVTGQHPRIYRQVAAGAEVSTIALLKDIPFAAPLYNKLNSVPVIRQILLRPPLILNPPMNKRTGRFERIAINPLERVTLDSREWLCYPAKVGTLLILIYFHNEFLELGHSLCNLFQLAEDEDLQRKPDAVYVFGVPEESVRALAAFPTVFYDDQEHDILVGAVPRGATFGYFGYLKKMVLTLHNIIMMKRRRLPFHGALVRLILKGDIDKTILFIGDTGAGKSETLEALRQIGEQYIQDIFILADDMGSLEIGPNGSVLGFGTEIGAFLRLDDLQPGYALGQIDRAIIMSPNQVNARIVLPVTTYEQVIKGHKVDCVLYANNYDEIDDEHPVVEEFPSAEAALSVFREGTVMSKGTTTSTGLVHSYFANIFGPPQYKELHEPLARKYFEAFFKAGIFVGQLRTRLGLAGWERKGPEEAARCLLEVMMSRCRKP